MRHLNLSTAIIASAAVLTACVSSTTIGERDDDGSGGAGASGGQGGIGNGGQGGQGGQGLAPGTCESRAGDHSAVCSDPGSCAITVDVEVECTDLDFAAGGVRALPAAGATYLGTTSNAPTRIYALAADSAELLELDIQSNGLAFAADASGRGFVAADETNFEGGSYEGGIVFAPLDGAEPKQQVYDVPDKFSPVHDLRMAADGTPRVWFNANAPDGHAMASRVGNTWSWSPVAIPPASDWEQFTLAADDTPQSFGFAGSSLNWQLRVVDGNSNHVLGSAVPYEFPLPYFVIDPPMPSATVTIPRFAAIIQHADGLRIASQTTQTFLETTLPNTALPTYSCDGGWDPPPCAADCIETDSGLAYSAFSAARTQDGQVWLAYAISHIDTTISYAPQDIDGQQICVGNVSSDRTTTTLHLVKLDVNGSTSTEVMTMDLPATGGESHFGSFEPGHPLVDVQAVGSDITVAIRLQKSRIGPFVARAMRIDTTKL